MTGRAKRKTAQERTTNWFRLGYLIHDVARMRGTLFDHHMTPHGLTRSQWWVLASLYRNETNEGMIGTDLARMIDIGKVTLGGLIDRLEARGYVERRPDAVDRRAKRIFITDKGLEVIEVMRDITTTMNQKVCVGLSEDQIAELESGMLLMKNNIRTLLQAQGDEQT